LFANNEIYKPFHNSRAHGVFGKNKRPVQPPWRGAPEARGPMQPHRLHRLKAGPAYIPWDIMQILIGVVVLRNADASDTR